MMLMKIRIIALLLSVLLTTVTQATPKDTPEDLSHFLDGKVLISQLEQVSQTVSHTASDMAVTALGFLGVPYKRGGNNAETGFDCSGFVKAMYEQTLGLILPRKAVQQAAVTQIIDKSDLQPGDLVFFNTMRHAFSHVGIYLGDGKFIHSPKPGAEVRVENMGQSYWRRRFDGARRVLNSAADELTIHPSLTGDSALR
jgi:cell wall-associated NlpC family hydrolase